MQKFGSNHTLAKLDAVTDYLKMYTQVLKYQGFELVYFDAFAGTGAVDISGRSSVESQFDFWKVEMSGHDFEAVEDSTAILQGSAVRALSLERPFDRYIFTEQARAKAKQLEDLKSLHPETKVEVCNTDANLRLLTFCKETNWRRTRAVVFLDPFGSQVAWSTIDAIARTEAIDLWYLFPAFWSVYRQISSDGRMTPEQEASICRILGTDEWKGEWLSFSSNDDLFNQPAIVGQKQIDVDGITRYMIARMKAIFAGGVLDEWLPLGPKKQHHFSLLFAWANPSDKAKLAAKLASYVMSRK